MKIGPGLLRLEICSRILVCAISLLVMKLLTHWMINFELIKQFMCKIARGQNEHCVRFSIQTTYFEGRTLRASVARIL